MTEIPFIATITICGLVCVTLIDIVGSILSRKLNFNYMWFSILSFAVFILVPYFLSEKFSLEISLIANALLGCYDETIGFQISKKLKANLGSSIKANKEVGILKRMLAMVVITTIFGCVGYFLGK